MADMVVFIFVVFILFFLLMFLQFTKQLFGTSACRPLVICTQNILKNILSAFIAYRLIKYRFHQIRAKKSVCGVIPCIFSEINFEELWYFKALAKRIQHYSTLLNSTLLDGAGLHGQTNAT